MTKHVYRPRTCVTCEKTYQPLSGTNKWCSTYCRLLDSCDKSGGDESCWTWNLAKDRRGYGYLMLRGIGSPDFAHRVMYREHNKVDISAAQVIRHACDNPACINPKHLLVGTQSENVQDMWKRNRQQKYQSMVRGENHGMATISNETAIAIVNDPCTAREAAYKYGTSASLVQRLRSGRSFSAVTGVKKGERRLGERHHNAVLTEQDVLFIVGTKRPSCSLAKFFNVSVPTIMSIRRGDTWSHVTGINTD